jgi:hypothetical protein
MMPDGNAGIQRQILAVKRSEVQNPWWPRQVAINNPPRPDCEGKLLLAEPVVFRDEANGIEGDKLIADYRDREARIGP